ncbi:hypothetical protein ACMFMG_010607 [Clarireedia jacksonii]
MNNEADIQQSVNRVSSRTISSPQLHTGSTGESPVTPNPRVVPQLFNCLSCTHPTCVCAFDISNDVGPSTTPIGLDFRGDSTQDVSIIATTSTVTCASSC